jgi:hypothetical protein
MIKNTLVMAVLLTAIIGINEKVSAQAVSKFGKIDIALLNAGVMDGTFSGDPLGGMGGAKTESLLMMNDSKHRMAMVWEQTSVILFLLSDEVSNLTGALYPTDGGWTAY